MFKIFKSLKSNFALAVGDEAHQAPLSVEQKALQSLLDKICDLQDTKGFSENNTAYTELLNEVDALLTKHPEIINTQDSNFKVTPMHVAAGSGLFELVKVLGKHNPDLSLQNCFGETPSQRAMKFAKRPDIAEYLNNVELAQIEQQAKCSAPQCKP